MLYILTPLTHSLHCTSVWQIPMSVWIVQCSEKIKLPPRCLVHDLSWHTKQVNRPLGYGESRSTVRVSVVFPLLPDIIHYFHRLRASVMNPSRNFTSANMYVFVNCGLRQLEVLLNSPFQIPRWHLEPHLKKVFILFLWGTVCENAKFVHVFHILVNFRVLLVGGSGFW